MPTVLNLDGTVNQRFVKKITIEEFKERADEYFKKYPIEEWTLTGLTLALGISEQTLEKYLEEENDLDYQDQANWCILKIKNAYETELRKNGGAPEIFAMKKFGWKDGSERAKSIDVNLSTIPETPRTEAAKRAAALAYEEAMRSVLLD